MSQKSFDPIEAQKVDQSGNKVTKPEEKKAAPAPKVEKPVEGKLPDPPPPPPVRYRLKKEAKVRLEGFNKKLPAGRIIEPRLYSYDIIDELTKQGAELELVE